MLTLGIKQGAIAGFLLALLTTLLVALSAVANGNSWDISGDTITFTLIYVLFGVAIGCFSGWLIALDLCVAWQLNLRWWHGTVIGLAIVGGGLSVLNPPFFEAYKWWIEFNCWENPCNISLHNDWYFNTLPAFFYLLGCGWVGAKLALACTSELPLRPTSLNTNPISQLQQIIREKQTSFSRYEIDLTLLQQGHPVEEIESAWRTLHQHPRLQPFRLIKAIAEHWIAVSIGLLGVTLTIGKVTALPPSFYVSLVIVAEIVLLTATRLSIKRSPW